MVGANEKLHLNLLQHYKEHPVYTSKYLTYSGCTLSLDQGLVYSHSIVQLQVHIHSIWNV